jgi:sirohydrochlorin cobaltochelatase
MVGLVDGKVVSRGLLLIGHGTRDQRGLAECRELAGLVAERLPDVAVELSFLELSQPDIGRGIDGLAARGVKEAVVVPLLLFAAGHAQVDIPAQLEAAARRHPDMKLTDAGVLGCHPLLLDLSAQRFRESLAHRQVAGYTLRLILVGRGGSVASATAETHRYARLLAGRVDLDEFSVAFMAVAEPGIGRLLASLEPVAGEWIVVQPHLLFQGDVLRELRERVVAWARRHGHHHWCVASHLGPCEQLAEVIASVAGEHLGGPERMAGSLDKE